MLFSANVSDITKIKRKIKIYYIMRKHGNDEVIPDQSDIDHYKNGIITPLEDIRIENEAKVLITILEKKKKKHSLMDLAGIWKNRKDIDKRFHEILKDRGKFRLRAAR